MRSYSFITIHPKIIESYRQCGVFRAAESRKIAEITAVHLRDFAADEHGSIDASPFGGGDGMVMRADCLEKALLHVRSLAGAQKEQPRILFTSPAGVPWTHKLAEEFSKDEGSLIFICGRFAGVDQRFIDTYVDGEYSVGDVVLAGGELPSLMMAESILRLVPGVLGHQSSAEEDSFASSMGGILEYPSYTRPQEWNGIQVPDVLLSGNHEQIAQWRRLASIERTKKYRPDLLNKFDQRSATNGEEGCEKSFKEESRKKSGKESS